MGIDPKSFEFAISRIDNGFVFEDFACAYLAQIQGYEFVPAGGIHDRGIDGLEHIFHRNGMERTIYQVSIESNAEGKLRASIEKLKANGVKYDQLYFISSRVIKNQDTITDELFENYDKTVRIRDINWLSAHVNDSQGTLNVFQVFVDKHLHEYSNPGKSYIVGDLINDPRLFVFLRQQWDAEGGGQQLDQIILDGLILFALEDTDPNKGILKTRKEISENIAKRLTIGNLLSEKNLDERLMVLSTKPRKINFHKVEDSYCLPYDTRLSIQDRNLSDALLHENFQKQSEIMLSRQLKHVNVKILDILALLESAFNHIFYQQGLEFTDFVLHGENREAFEKQLTATIRDVVEQSSIVGKNREQVHAALMITIREIVYNGSPDQKIFLKRLSNTYLMLFLLQCDPKVSTFFASMAGKLHVYVCTSIIIPAMSEFYLDPPNRRHWNLLKGARDSGVTLIINETILRELMAHFQLIKNTYEEQYKYDEKAYLTNEILTLYIDEILIRAYFYAKLRNKVGSFSDFINNFLSPDFKNAEDELIAWLEEEFGIKYVSDDSLIAKPDKNEIEQLFQSLKNYKSSPAKARSDARMILTIYAIRSQRNEKGTGDIFGYRTWLLSKDTVTLRAVNDLFGEKYPVSCYMRPDFLYNYISLAPKPAAVRESFNQMFPTLLGVNISYHLAPDIVNCVHQAMKEHKAKNQARRTAILRSLASELQTNPAARSKKYVKHYLDDKLSKITEA